jgi:hypothetical protein
MMGAFVPRNTGGGHKNGASATRAKPADRAAPPVQSALWTVMRMAAEVAALPVRWLWKNQLAPGNTATTMTGNDNNEKSAEDPNKTLDLQSCFVVGVVPLTR